MERAIPRRGANIPATVHVGRLRTWVLALGRLALRLHFSTTHAAFVLLFPTGDERPTLSAPKRLTVRRIISIGAESHADRDIARHLLQSDQTERGPKEY